MEPLKGGLIDLTVVKNYYRCEPTTSTNKNLKILLTKINTKPFDVTKKVEVSCILDLLKIQLTKLDQPTVYIHHEVIIHFFLFK